LALRQQQPVKRVAGRRVWVHKRQDVVFIDT
jgi:hypothetical protein